MSTEPASGVERPEPAPDDQEGGGPSELESALLTIVLFGGLVVFAIGCTMFLW